MGFDLAGLRAAVAAHGRVVRVVVAELRGSSPREVGTAMLVWDGGQSGTVGGGALEYEAANAARARRRGLSRHALGPDLGQCCGGAVALLTEQYDARSVEKLSEHVIARPATEIRQAPGVGATALGAEAGNPPLSVQRLLTQARGQGVRLSSQLLDGWFVEQVQVPERSLWIWGAGHVGRAMVRVFAPLPEFDLTWVDTAPDRFPADVPERIAVLPAANPSTAVPYAPADAEHLILTYSHALDLDLCHRLLNHGFRFAGLIGSRTKWARFQSRLAGLGHSPEQIARITCPIGVPELGKHPQAIAIGVGSRLLQAETAGAGHEKEIRA